MTKFQLKIPVVLIIFNRPDTTEKVFEAIREVKPPQLFVIADAPRPNKPGEAEKCMAVKTILNRVNWQCEVLTNYAEINMGCRERVSSGLNWVFSLVESAIILEDDCVPHPTFFRFCQELLERYRDDDRIMAISGDNFQFGNNLTEYSYYFSRYSHCWGWATWRRAWKNYDNQMQLWSKFRDINWLDNILQNSQAVKYWSQIFQDNYQGFNSWAYAWIFAAWSQNGLTILPNVNLVSNIGFGEEATHTLRINRLANISVQKMIFPLNHPTSIGRNIQADDFTEKTIFSGSLPQQCKVCGAASYYFDNAKILDKYNINYFQCSNCGFVQTEHPYWLGEAYSQPIASSDVGLVKRNIELSQITEDIINTLFSRQDKFLDYGSGYGLLVRLMRDSGLDFYGYDRYCENIFSQGFQVSNISDTKYELITAFEVFEHLVNPIAEIEQILNFSQNVLFSTKLLPKENPQPQDWWYYALAEGQHISIYTFKSLSILAARFKLKLYSYGNSLHLLTKQEISPHLFHQLCQIEPTIKKQNILTEQKYLKIMASLQKTSQELVEHQLKILVDGVFFQLNNTGIARVWKSLLSAWVKDGFAQHILVLDRGGNAPKIPGIEYRTVPRYDYSRIESDRQILQGICDAEQADLFISTYYTTPISTPSVFMAYDMIPEVFGKNLNHPEWQEKHHGISHGVSYITISENTARDLIKYFPNISSDLVTVAHCGVDDNFSIASTQEVTDFKLKYNISNPYFLIVGERIGWQGYKNTSLFFQSFSQLPNSENLEIVCVGGKPELETEIREFISESKLHLLQLNDDELKIAYSGAIALIYPSKYEGFGMPIVEAMACGCPVITCRNASIPEVAGTAALYINDGDINGLVNALSEVQKLEVRQLLIEAGLAQAKKFSWSEMAKIVSSVLEKTASNILTSPSESINTGQLVLQRQFWNVNSLDEAMFRRVFTDDKINAMSPQEKMEAWQNSILSSTHKILRGIPINKEWKVLEIGCGVGRLIKPLREIFAEVDGVDISEKMIQFAKQYLADGKQNGEVYVNNGCDLKQLTDQIYDFVYSIIVFQHIRSISIVKSYFRETFRVLKPGGYFRLQVHDHSASDLGNFDEEGAENKQYYLYGNAYTEAQLQDLLVTETGFNLVSLECSKPWIWATVKRPEKLKFTPQVSAIVSTYNSEKFIRGCLEDLVNQTLYKKGELEIIIIDSASEQKEGAIAQEFQTKYPHIIYQRTSERETIYAAWNRAIKIATGNYITNANTDDRHRPDALEKMANYLDNYPHTSLVYADQLVTTIPNDTWATTEANKRWNWPQFDYSELERRCIIGPQPMWRKSLHQKYGYFPSEFSVAGDYEFWLRIGKTEKIERLPEILGLYFDNKQGLEKADQKAKQETDNICNEYGIFQRGVQRKISVTTDISELELISLPFRESQRYESVEKSRDSAAELTSLSGTGSEKLSVKNFPSESVEKSRDSAAELTSLSSTGSKKFLAKNRQVFSVSTDESLDATSDNFLSQSDLISVIILCYNQAEYLTEAVESIVNQTYQNWECLIVNDGSSDSTGEVAKNLVDKYPEKSLRLLEKENTGVPDSRNVGVNHSRGKFILFVDADDKIHPNFLTETLAVLKANPQVGFVYTDIHKFGFEEKLESFGDFNVKRFLSKNQAPVTSLFRREIYQQVGGFKTVMKDGWEDWEFWISAYQKSWLGYRLEKPYLYYRQHSAGSRQQKLHQNQVNLAVHKAIIIYLHSQLYNQQEVVWSKQILDKYRISLMTELNQLKSQITIKYPKILPISGGNDRPLWSVMIPTYNPTSTLEKTLKSVLQQAANMNQMQIEVVDDCSTQVDVGEVVKKIGQGRISYYRQPQNLGLIANWNDCIKRASGQWVHILHQDDLVLPEFYSRLRSLLENNAQVGAAFCRHYYIDENDNQKMLSPLERETPGIISNWLEKIAVMQRIQCASIVVKRQVYEEIGGFSPDANSAADWEMWKRIAAYYQVSYEPQTLACYRWHSKSESSRLIKFGGNIADTRKAIEISESYLPPKIATKLSNQAREHYAISAIQVAEKMLSVGKAEVAIAQIQEALKCSQSSQVKEAIISLFITSDSTPQINTNQLLSEIVNYLEQYQNNISNESVLNNLRQLRQQIANYWLNLPTEKLESAYLTEIGKAHKKLIDSSLKYEQITDKEKLLVSQIATHISQGLNQQNSIQYLLAATLYYYPHQLSENWFEQAPIPKWFVNDYMKFMIDAPSYFQEIGEADNYYRYTLNWINYLHQRIFNNSDSKLWQDIAWFLTQKFNFIPLYFNYQNLKDIYIKRAEIMELALESRGFKLDYLFPERPANRNKIRLGILSSHFIPQTETFSTLPFFEHLDRSKFEIILYAKSLTEYPLEKYCQSLADRLVKLPDNLINQVETIRADDLDILLIGTNVTAITNSITLLALHRIARIQLTSTSSCVTTGMKHIDYYISGKLTEPQQEAQQQYREQLITLKRTAHCFNYYPTEPEKPVVKPSRESWGVNDKNIVFVSGANFYKIIPELRETWAKIIAAIPNSVLALYPFNPNWSNSYQASTHFVNDIRSIFSKYGIDKKRLIVIKTLPSRSDVKECLKLCDVYLDSYPFAGVNSLIEPLEIGLPIVTKDGNSFRSLMGSALLRSLSIPDLITNSEADYINLAIKLANNSKFRQQKRQQIQAKMQQNPSFLDSRDYSAQIGKLFQELFQKWQNIHTPKTRESTSKNSLSPEFINRLLGCVNLYEIDPTDQSLIQELRQLRKQIADFWLETPPKELENIYQGKIRQAYQALLASGIQNEPQTEDEQKFLKELVDISIGLTNPKAVNALLGGMLYFPPGKMLVRDAKKRLPKWLINDYKQVFESREVAEKLENAFQSKSPHLSEYSISRGVETKPQVSKPGWESKPLQTAEFLTKNQSENLDSANQKFLNQLLGSVNLYYIDPSDESVVKELRQVRKQMADFWINLEPKKLDNFYLGEMGKGYQALLNSGIQNQSLIESEQEFLQQLATQLAKGIEAPKAINYLLAVMLYCRPEQLRIEDISKLPYWLLEDYQKFIGNL
ncbi:MAG: glycosyltransferase [Microcoleaceae cyanobacterium MO_207.B10]|nr:glycosyltransferase [Microcoleaceae cyanobacterium MO_207.B10]